MAKKVENIGIYNALVSQLDKLARHNRQGSFRTKERYYEAVKRFCAYLADEYRLPCTKSRLQALTAPASTTTGRLRRIPA